MIPDKERQLLSAYTRQDLYKISRTYVAIFNLGEEATTKMMHANTPKSKQTKQNKTQQNKT